MNLSTTLNKLKQGEGGNALLFFIKLVPLIFILASVFSCGIPSPVYLAPPERISTSNPSFYHADRNNPDIFRGYEIFYLFYNSDTAPFDTFASDDEWETYFNGQISTSTIANPNSSLMTYLYSYNEPDHKIRRAYASDSPADEPEYIPVMVPVYPDSVGLSGGTEARFQLIFDIGSSELFLEVFSSSPQTKISNYEAPYVYDKSSVILKRRVFNELGDTFKTLLSFDIFSASEPNADPVPDDLPSTYDAIAFFAVTTGFSFSTGQAIISSVTYIGSLNL
jgi:hypothetical protein